MLKGLLEMKLWVDDVRPAPKGYIWCRSVMDAVYAIGLFERALSCFQWEIDTADFRKIRDGIEVNVENVRKAMQEREIELIDIDHDAGDYVQYGGDYIKLLDWLEETGRNYPIRIHSMNPVGVANMRAIIQKNGWKEV